jgi:large subunit ribosomal protein L10
MASSKEKKAESLSELSAAAKRPAIVFASFKGLKANDTARLRKVLREAGVTYRVAKKTLVRKAFADSALEGDMPKVDGELALAWSDEALAPARELRKFEKELQGAISIQGGVFEGVYKNKAEMVAIADIPSREVLLSMLANLLNSPMQRFAVGIKAVADSRA